MEALQLLLSLGGQWLSPIEMEVDWVYLTQCHSSAFGTRKVYMVFCNTGSGLT